MNLSMNDLIEVGEEIITAESERACSIFERSSGEAAVKRSKLKVYTGFCRMDEKRWRITERENSSSAGGTTCITRVWLLPSIRASSGATTVVLPCPMIIWLTRDSSACAAETNWSTSFTCCGRSSRLNAYSKASSRGSKVTPPLAAALI